MQASTSKDWLHGLSWKRCNPYAALASQPALQSQGACRRHCKPPAPTPFPLQLPCFGYGKPLEALRARFRLELSDAQAAEYMKGLILGAYDRFTTGEGDTAGAVGGVGGWGRGEWGWGTGAHSHGRGGCLRRSGRPNQRACRRTADPHLHDPQRPTSRCRRCIRLHPTCAAGHPKVSTAGGRKPGCRRTGLPAFPILILLSHLATQLFCQCLIRAEGCCRAYFIPCNGSTLAPMSTRAVLSLC